MRGHRAERRRDRRDRADPLDPRGRDDGHARRGGRRGSSGRSSLLVVAVKAYALEAALDRIAPGALEGAVVLPLLNGLEHVEPIRARLGAGDRRRGGQHRQRRGLLAGARASSSRRPRERSITAASDALGRRALEARSSRSPCPALELVVDGRRARVLWDKAARLAVLAAATDRLGAGRSARFVTTPRGGRRLASRPRRGVRRRARPTASQLDAGRAVGDHRGDAREPRPLCGPRRGRRPARPSSTRSRARSCAPLDGSASGRPRSRGCSPTPPGTLEAV